MIQDKIRELVQYGLLTGLVSAEDEIYTTNRLLGRPTRQLMIFVSNRSR